MLVHTWASMWIKKQKSSAAMLVMIKRSVGVASELNLRNPLHTDNEAHKQRIQKVKKNRGTIGSTPNTDVLQKLFLNVMCKDMNRYRNLIIILTFLQVKMKKATGKGLQLGSYFEKKDGDDLSADDIIPEVMKPWSKVGKMKPETVLVSFH